MWTIVTCLYKYRLISKLHKLVELCYNRIICLSEHNKYNKTYFPSLFEDVANYGHVVNVGTVSYCRANNICSKLYILFLTANKGANGIGTANSCLRSRMFPLSSWHLSHLCIVRGYLILLARSLLWGGGMGPKYKYLGCFAVNQGKISQFHLLDNTSFTVPLSLCSISVH